jgi:hypothetical protein
LNCTKNLIDIFLPQSATLISMHRKIAPTKITGGGGFAFEDKVTAFFMCYLLSGRHPLDANLGNIEKISLQVRVDGWLLDDLLLTLGDGSVTRHCAFSIKSNPQFSRTSAPAEFVKDAWRQYLGEAESIFKKDKDRIGLITAPLSTETKTRLEELLNKARTQHQSELARRIDEKGYISKEARNIFKSFSCPKELADKYSIDDTAIGELLKYIEHLDFDFEHSSSIKESDAISILRNILYDNSTDDARNLWDTLCSIARDVRAQGGYIDLSSLAAKLRRRYRLKDFPDYAPIWKEIKQRTSDVIALVQDRIADIVSIDRSNEIAKIVEQLKEHQLIVLLGESGCGKTVIEKLIVDSQCLTSKVVWINTETISHLEDLPSWDLFKAITDENAFLIIDGADRFYDDSQFGRIALLLKACLHSSETSPWKIIISCQPDEWARVQYNLSKLPGRTEWESITLQIPSDEALTPVWEEFPSLQRLILHMHLRSFLFKPKVLDLFARKIKNAGGAFDARAFSDAFSRGTKVGESHLIAWYWEQEIENQADGLTKSIMLKRIAENIADNLVPDIPASGFTPDELSVIQELDKDRILTTRNDRIAFEHDIVADWARLRILLEKLPNEISYSEDRLLSPQWCKALRLLGVHLLETPSDIKEWKQLFDSFAEPDGKGNVSQDLLLEASIFSADPRANLERLWKELQKQDGRLLRRLLSRFLYSASFPNKFALLFASQHKDEAMSELIATNRDPYWLYWWPFIEFLHSHKDTVTSLAKRHVAEIADRWLRFSKKDWPARAEAACIAIDIAEDELALNMSDVMYLDQVGMVRYAYRAGIAALNEQPERVFNFVQTACSRKAPSGRISALIMRHNEEVRLQKEQAEQRRSKEEKERLAKLYSDSPQLLTEMGPIPAPWPDGPLVRVDRVFRQLCLESDSDTDILYPLILSNPEKAHEVILALLIEEPTPRDRYESRRNNYTGIANHIQGWFPPFYTRGPFYFFLNAHPDKALDLIITLINFATERWAEGRSSEGREPPYVEIELLSGKRKFTGDALVYYWHRDVGAISHIIPSALMALEKWLYDKFDNDETKDKALSALSKILQSGTSLAFVGLLISIGKKYPTLFIDNLLPLLSIPEFYSWDNEHIIKSEGHQMIGWFGKGDILGKAAQEFNKLEHRKYSISMIAPRIFVLYEDTREFFRKFREKWISRYESGKHDSVSADVFINLIQWFDISNWKLTEDPEHRTQYEFEMPGEITEQREAGLKDMADRQALVFLPVNFRLILEGEKEISPNSAEQIWDSIQHVEDIEISQDDPDIGILQKENSACGGIAVLFKHYREWLNRNPDKETWCITKITELILNPPLNESSFDSEVSIANWMWDRYCAEVMPLIWAKEPANRLYRRCMATLALNKHYETVGILFRSASALRRDMGSHFKQLINFMTRWTHARWKFHRERYSDKKTFDVNRWLENEVYLFEHEEIPNNLESWHDIAKEEMNRRTKLYEKERKKRGDGWKPPKDEYFDFWLLKAALSWLPPLNQAINREERAEWLLFWKQAITWTISILETDEDDEMSGTPSDWDRWIFEQMAIQTLQMEDSEKPEELWRPILELGAEGHYWVDDFLMEWFIKGIGYDAVSNNFIKRWKQILEYAFTSKKWSASRGRFWFYRNNLWCELLGMNYLVSGFWSEDRESILTDMKPYYEKWAKDFLTDPKHAVLFIYFLQRPAAKNMLLDALVWLDNASDNAGEAFFTDRHHNVQRLLANLLEVSWKNQKTAIRGNSASYGAYKNLLRKLVDIQNPQAIEIQQNLLLGGE